MKKQLIILSALTVLGSPWALAQNSEITVTPLPAAQPAAEVEIDLSGSPQSTEIDALVRQAIAESNTAIRTYPYIQHVDLRDVIKYDSQIKQKLIDIDGITDDKENSDYRLRGTSDRILKAVKENTERFIGAPGITYFEDGAKGPTEKASELSRAERKRKPFVIGSRFPETYTNTLFSVDYIQAKEIAKSVIEADLLLFAHSDSKGPFFKKITVVVDWKKKNDGFENFVAITKSGEDILLAETDFFLKGSIADQKIVLEDQNFGLTKVFPVTVGAIDARDNIVESMNFHVPASNRRAARKAGLDPALQEEFQDFSNAALINRKVWDTGSSWANTSERVKPYDYKGRPFMALVDLNYVNLNAEKIKYSTGYREVGIHYQITSSRLERGFRSHGCVRVRDKDLYQVDAIVNQGPKDMIKAIFKKSLPGYKNLNHPHEYNKSVAMVKYTDFKSAANSTNILCKVSPEDKSRSVRWNSDNKVYHTVIGNDCLTSTAKETGVTSADVKAYWNGTGDRIKPHFVSEEHGPVKTAITTLLQHGYLPATIDAMTHRQRLEAVVGLKDGSIRPISGSNAQLDLNEVTQSAPTKRWPSISGNIISVNESNRIAGRLKKGKFVSRANTRAYWRRLYYVFCSQPATPSKYDSRCSEFRSKAR